MSAVRARCAGIVVALVALGAGAAPAFAVTGGTPAPAGAAGFAAALVASDNADAVAAGQFCGATFVRPDALVTAAHCIVQDADEEPDVSQTRVFAGTRLPLARGKLARVAAVTVQPKYDDDRGESNNDVAVIRLAAPVRGVATAALPAPADAPTYAPGAPLTIYGWGNRAYVDGSTADDVNLPRALQQGTVGRYADTRCDDLYGRYFNPATQLCAGLPAGGVDACNGDSGGPLVSRRADGRAVLVGIVSYGEGCGRPQFPTVYTKVSRFAGWITQQLDAPLPRAAHARG